MEDCSAERPEPAAWTAAIREKYMAILVSALCHVPEPGGFEPGTCSPRARGRAVKAAADLSLAITSGGRTAWSRAILAQSRKKANSARRSPLPRLRGRAPGKKYAPGPRSRGGRARTVGERKQLRTLKRLVPGGGPMDTPVLLREAADYIAALQMQVEAMRALANQCANLPR